MGGKLAPCWPGTSKNGPLFPQRRWGLGAQLCPRLLGLFPGGSCRPTRINGIFLCVQETFLVLSSEDHQSCALLAQKSRIAWEKQLEKAALQLFGFFSLFSVRP